MEIGNSHNRGPSGVLGAGSFTRTLRDRLRRVLETEHLSLWELWEGNVEGELLLLGTLKDMYSKALEKERSLMGNMEGTVLYGDFERKVRFCFIKRPCFLENTREI